jgi:hypothetical protein
MDRLLTIPVMDACNVAAILHPLLAKVSTCAGRMESLHKKDFFLMVHIALAV